MPGLNWAVAVPLVLAVAACGAPKTETPTAGEAADAPVDQSPSKIPLRGILATSGAVTTFRECGAPPSHVLTVTDRAGELAKAVVTFSRKPSEGIYAELDGAPEVGGQTLAWTALVRAHALREIVACDAPVFDGEFAASGNEPFWSVEIR